MLHTAPTSKLFKAERARGRGTKKSLPSPSAASFHFHALRTEDGAESVFGGNETNSIDLCRFFCLFTDDASEHADINTSS
mmetsp:Transcript_12617/g.27310  ORF Transcript_12617/g.27310 Transcript_12617/m.27310 type:complete len:80 (-) Transcript_12617:276-515(-)